MWILELVQGGETEAGRTLFRRYAKFENGLAGEFFRYCSILQLVGESGLARDCFENLLAVDPENSEAQAKLRDLKKP